VPQQSAEAEDKETVTRRRLSEIDSVNARLGGFKHLQVILQPLVTVEKDGEVTEAPALSDGPVYRMALSYDCQAELPEELMAEGFTSKALVFSQIALVDFELVNFTKNKVGYVRSALLPQVEKVEAPHEFEGEELDMSRFNSMSCPRFVPSQRGSRILFTTEFDSASADERSTEGIFAMSERRLAITRTSGGPMTLSSDFEASWLNSLKSMPKGFDVKGKMFDCGSNTLPCAPVHGCPEFVPSLYVKPESITDTIMEKMKSIEKEMTEPGTLKLKDESQLKEWKLRDTFVYTSNTFGSATVLDVDAQVIAAELPDHNLDQAHKVKSVEKLYNVKSLPPGIGSGGAPTSRNQSKALDRMLMLEGCQPIRAAGRKGHMRLQWAFETVLMTLRVPKDTRGYSTWLACLTADQRVAIVESPREEYWTNMSMPNPVWVQDAKIENVWCPTERAEGCFEVWSSPNPNEIGTV